MSVATFITNTVNQFKDIHTNNPLEVLNEGAQLLLDINATTDVGLKLLELFMFIPIFVVVYVPLLVLRTHLQEKVDEARYEAIKASKGTTNPAVIEELDKTWIKLRKAEVWPCGNYTAVRYFTFMIMLLVAIFAPKLGIFLCFLIALSVVARQVLPKLSFGKE
jgi:hypothetical protein